MGGGATTSAVFYEHNVIFTDVIPVGGNHVTSDIARGLSTPLVHAERTKTLHRHVITAPTHEREPIDVPQVGEDDSSPSPQIPRPLLVGLIHPTLADTLVLLRSRHEPSRIDQVARRQAGPTAAPRP